MTPEHFIAAGIGIAAGMIAHLGALIWRAHRARIRITKSEDCQ